MTYADLLRDPRWQRRRLEIMERADFRCELCGDDRTTLNVHHRRYVRGRMPWQYGDEDLTCLCEPCHEAQHPEKRRGLTPLSAIVPRVVSRLVVEDRYNSEICIVCYASWRVDLTRCADCREDHPLPAPTEGAA